MSVFKCLDILKCSENIMGFVLKCDSLSYGLASNLEMRIHDKRAEREVFGVQKYRFVELM
jgi:hypothetical protein